MRTLIVHNLKSGFGSDAIFEFQRALVEKGDEVVMRILPSNEGAADSVVDAEDFDLVVASGGDGTIANLMFALRGRDVLTCVFPSGTANLFFANLGNSMEPRAIARSCRHGRVARTDLGVMRWHDEAGTPHEHGFGIMAGSGFDALLMEAAVPNKKTMGEAAYFTAALSNMHPDVQEFAITIDGVTHRREGIACIVANNAMVQGDVEIVPDCSMSDGELDVIVLENSEAVQLLRPLFAALLDPQGTKTSRPYIEHFTGRKIRVESSSPIPMQIDGEVFDGVISSYEAEVLPGCCKLVVDPTSRYNAASTEDIDFEGDRVIPFPEA